MGAGAAARVVVRPDLAAHVVVSELAFTAYYALLVGSLASLEPAYVARVWSRAGAEATRIGGLPVVELAYGASFGAVWSGLHEQYRWTFRRPVTGAGADRA